MSSEPEPTDDLLGRIQSLSPMGVRFVSRLVASVATPPRSTALPTSWIGSSPEWVEYFGYGLAGHHGVTVEHLGLTGFEVAFRDACEAVGWGTSEHASATQRFVDLTVDRDGISRRLSLKSTGARRLSRTTAHISKLTEAAWIQDMRGARDRRDRTLELFRSYRDAVDAIVMLRAFRTPGQVPDRYELLEIPAAIFGSLEDTSVADFSADGPQIPCSYGDDPVAAVVSLDRSDAKITVRNIKLSACTVHAQWELLGAPRD